MKHLASFLLAAATLLAVSCQEKEPAKVEKFTVDRTSVTLQDGLEGSVDIYFTSENVTPAASSNDSWLTVEVFARALTISYTLNDSGAERTGKVIVTPGSLDPVEITVKQPAYVAPPADAVKVGDKTEDGKGMIYWVSPENPAVGKAVSLERTTGLKWSDDESPVAGGASYVNGAANTAALVAADKSTYAAAAWCADLGEGWYLPARDELVQLFDIYNGVSHSDPSFVLATVPNLSAAEKNARSKFDDMLKAAGAAEENIINTDGTNGNSYWTSSAEEGAGDSGAYYVRFGKYDCPSTGVKKSSTSRYVRCIKTVGNYTYPGEPVKVVLSATSLNLEGPAEVKTVTATTLKNGVLASASVAPAAEGGDASWCTAAISGSDINITVTENNTGAVRAAVVTVTVNASSADISPVTLTVSISQAAANVEKFKLLEVYKENGTAKGIVFWVSEDGQKAKIIALTRLGGEAWSNEGTSSTRFDFKQLGLVSNTDGAANTAAIRENAAKESVTVPFLAYLDGLGEGWYLPARDELRELAAAYYGVAAFGDISAVVPSSLPEAQKAATEAFEAVMKGAGGDAVNTAEASANGESYFSSTEVKSDVKIDGTTVSDTYYASAYYVRFGKYVTDKGTKDGKARYFRGVKLVSK